MVTLRPGVGGQGKLGCCMEREILDGLPRYRSFVVLRADVVTGSAMQDLQGQSSPVQTRASTPWRTGLAGAVVDDLGMRYSSGNSGARIPGESMSRRVVLKVHHRQRGERPHSRCEADWFDQRDKRVTALKIGAVRAWC